MRSAKSASWSAKSASWSAKSASWSAKSAWSEFRFHFFSDKELGVSTKKRHFYKKRFQKICHRKNPSYFLKGSVQNFQSLKMKKLPLEGNFDRKIAVSALIKAVIRNKFLFLEEGENFRNSLTDFVTLSLIFSRNTTLSEETIERNGVA